MRPLSPITLKILRLDYDSVPKEAIANELKITSSEAQRIITKYRLRYLLMRLAERRDAFINDILAGYTHAEINAIYGKMPAHIYQSAMKFKDKLIKSGVEPELRISCQKCTRLFFAKKHRYICPTCQFHHTPK